MDFGVYKQPAARARSSEPHPQRKHTGLSLRDELEEVFNQTRGSNISTVINEEQI